MMNKNMHLVKNVAIVVQEKRKNELIEWSFQNRYILAQHQIIALGENADVLEGTLNVPILKLAPGSIDGYEQLGKMISEKEVDVIIFLWDAKKTLPYESDIKTLQLLAEENDLVIATNKRTAEAVLSSSYFNHTNSSEGECENAFTGKAAV